MLIVYFSMPSVRLIHISPLTYLNRAIDALTPLQDSSSRAIPLSLAQLVLSNSSSYHCQELPYTTSSLKMVSCRACSVRLSNSQNEGERLVLGRYLTTSGYKALDKISKFIKVVPRTSHVNTGPRGALWECRCGPYYLLFHVRCQPRCWLEVRLQCF